jgi:BMFP domain-containing protein YqiC
MSSDNKIFEDISRIANSAIGAIAGAGKEAEGAVRDRIEKYLDTLHLVRREEFDAVKAMAENARAENEKLAARLAALEAKTNL